MANWIRFLVIVALTAYLCSQGIPSLAQSVRQVQFEQSTPAQLIQSGKEHYSQGQYAAAIATWQQAAHTYDNQNDRINQGSALSNIGLAHLRLGNYPEAERAISTARSHLNTIPNSPYPQSVLAQIISAQAQLSMAKGRYTSALEHLNQAAELYQVIGDFNGLLRTQLNQAQILQVQGRYLEASRQLETTRETLENLDAPAIQAAGFRQLSHIQQFNGETDNALASLVESRRLAETFGFTTELSSTFLSLGNLIADSHTETGESPETSAATYYQQAAAVAPTVPLRLQAQINLLGLQIDKNDGQELALLNTIQTELPNLGTGHTENLIRLNLANHLLKAESIWSSEELEKFLIDILERAEASQDGQSQSYAKGYLGRLYETNQQLDTAEEITREAWNLALASNSTTALYQWQWQLGRILATQRKTEAAISSYKQSITTLEKVRRDLVSASADLQFSFREEVEPVYRELVSLLVQSEASIENSLKENLLDARTVIENLQVAELVDFFRADCVVTNPTSIDEVDASAAVVYPIILDHSLEIIVRYPGQNGETSLKRYHTEVDKNDVEHQLKQLQQVIAKHPNTVTRNSFAERLRGRTFGATIEISRIGDTPQEPDDFFTPAAQVYDWLIRPMARDLEQSKPEVMVFVLDGALRNVPMSILYDKNKQQYLIEQVAIALTPGLQLIDPKPIARGEVKALVGAISDKSAVPDFSPLPNVETEIKAIQTAVPSAVLHNQEFLKESFAERLSTLPFPVVHLATHGKFSSNLDDTYVLAWDQKINANELSSMLQTGELTRGQDIELLVLSACETASGTDRAALGLAGIAIRSGARSTLASLWQVDDEGTSVFMSSFYDQLANTSLTKAAILRQVQLNLLQTPAYEHPYFWAPFVLIGNWL